MLKQWLRWMWENEDGFFGIGQGPSNAQKNEAGALINIGNFGTSEGEKDILQSDKFWSALMSGDQTKISQVLGPQMTSINRQGQQAKKTASEFGNRGGGTNAGTQMTDDKTRQSIDSMIASLTGTAASTVGSTGSSLLSTGLAGHEAGFGAASKLQELNASKWNDIFKSITSVASALIPGGKAAKAAFPNMSPGQISGSYGGPSSVETQPLDTSSWDQQL